MDINYLPTKKRTAMRMFYLIATMILIIGCTYNDQKDNTAKQGGEEVKTKEKNPWEVLFVKGQVIYFRNKENLKTHLSDLKYIGQLTADNKAPYLILSGKSCNNCDENISIYIHSPDDGEMKSYGKQTRYTYPGRELDFASNELVFESKMYYGDCLKDYPNSVVWKQRSINDQNELEESTYIVQVHNDALREISIVDKNIFEEVSKEECCKEVEGIEMVSEP